VLESGSRGLIGSTNFGVFPNITPTQCFAITIGFSFVYLTKLWLDPSYKRFLDSIVLSAMTSFLWGWHVHEKAVLLFLIPLSLTATENDAHYNVYLISTTAGVYSLFPLLIHTAETPIKFILAGVWAYLVFPSLRRVVYQPAPNLLSFLVKSLERLYLLGFVLVQLYVGFIHEYVFPPLMEFPIGPGGEATPFTSGIIELAGAVASNQSSTIIESVVKEMSQTAMEGTMEFLPLMLISVYCAIGISWSWLRLSWIYLTV
jgi:alpha-1,3-glucosyltransferase